MQKIVQAVQALVRSRAFFVAVLVLFVIESAWIALSARYPMAFDENYHLGVIQLYAHQLSPLLLHQPPGAAPYGAVTRDASYLYHWLMSFPYRWLRAVFDLQTTIIALRFIDIGFFAGSLVLWRRLLLKTRASRGVVNVALLFFVLVPTVPLLAGQINYDNLMMLLIPLNLLMVLRFRDQLQKKRLNIGLLAGTFSLALLASLEKYPYLPILTAITLYLGFLLWQFAKLPRHSLKRELRKAWALVSKAQKIAIVALVVVSCGLFVEMYGVNVVKYHNLTPQCGQVLGVQRCLTYGPWARNYHYSMEPKPRNYSSDPLVFLGGWGQGMFMRSFFTINGPGEPASYQNFKPLPLISLAAMATFGFGLFLVFRYCRDIFPRDPVLQLLLFVSFAYILALLGKNYFGYLEYGRLLAINGRYLLPIILPILVVIGMAYRHWLSKSYQVLLLGCVLLLFLQGGGAITFIVQSNANWYWPNDQFVQHLNKRAQTVLRPFMVDWSGRG